MLQHKDISKLSEINTFFISSEKAIETILRFTRSLTFSDKRYGFSQSCNLIYSNYCKILLVLLFPIFDIKSSADYSNSGLYRFFSCGKDVFYRLINDASINWRGLAYSLNLQILRKVERQSETNSNPSCLIIDDTDLPKTGRCIELIGRIYSHVIPFIF